MEMEKYKPAITLVLLQFTVAGVALFTKAAFMDGLSPAVFVVYRQAIATLFICPISFFFTWRKASKPSLGVRGFWWVAFTAVVGVTVNQNAYFAGIDLSSSSMASATTNLVPAVTFIISIIVGFERIKRSLKSVAKVIGTCVCVGGAMAMTFLKGPKLLNTLLKQDNNTWLLGCFFLLISTFAWSFWLILQVNIAVHCPDHLYTTSWTCFMATIASFLMALALGNTDLHSWKLDSSLKLSCCVYSGLQLAVFFFLQAWCVSRKGPLFSALFNPLSTVIVTFFGALYLNEKTYLASLLGALAIILGLYIVLWGKSEDYQEEATEMKLQDDHTNLSQLLIGDKAFRSSELSEPLLM
ncbi:WAT1-related protein [Raphanus sativus]|nr:WAT1-related protein [Raphanus sativus]